MPPTRAHRHNRVKLSEMTVTDDLTEFRGQYRLWRRPHEDDPWTGRGWVLVPCAGTRPVMAQPAVSRAAPG